MNIPKKIEKLIDQRCRYAEMVEKIDYELSTWLKKNKINVDEQDVFVGNLSGYAKKLEEPIW